MKVSTVVTIEAQFPEVKGNCYASAKGSASTLPAAFRIAITNLMKSERVKHKRITAIKATISIAHIKTEENDNGSSGQEDKA